MWYSFVLGNTRCSVFRTEKPGPLFLWPVFHGGEEERERLTMLLKEMVPEAAFALAAFEVEDWDRDLSPWKTPAAIGEKWFEGHGRATTDWIREQLMPYLDSTGIKADTCFLMGYSLAGLFALWSLYENPDFAGAVCCSGSLWIDGWDTYCEEHRLHGNDIVYLSLGGKEEKTSNPRMARVGDRTREQLQILKSDPGCMACVLEWNSGGHFADSARRLAKGIRWTLNQLSAGETDTAEQKRGSYSYFSHRECEYFPCHEAADPENFNCLFCYCPLYCLGDGCGGDFAWLSNGIKDCSGCLVPHRRENYEWVIGQFAEIADHMAKEQVKRG